MVFGLWCLQYVSMSDRQVDRIHIFEVPHFLLTPIMLQYLEIVQMFPGEIGDELSVTHD